MSAIAEDVTKAGSENKEEEKNSPHHLSGTIGAYSDYLFRGLSFAKHGAVQATIDYNHDNGVYFGFGYSNVHKDAIYGNTWETDYYAGYKKTFTDDFAITVGLFNFTYPQKYKFVGQNSNVLEWNAVIEYKNFSIKYSHALTDWFGYNTASLGTTTYRGKPVGSGDSKGTNYTELNYTDKLLDTETNYHLHIGHQIVRNYSVADYTDMSVGISRSFEFAKLKGWNAGISYIMVNTREGWYVDSGGDDLDKNRLFGYIRLTM
jgi:uncharacterized protein (TIGR02001 family)